MANEFSSSTTRHRLFGNSGYNIPQPKFLYYVNFVSNKVPPELTKQLNFFVKRVDRIQLNYAVEEMNQYNKKRLIHTKVNYGPLNIAFHDTTDSSALKMVEAYNRFHFSEFENKENFSWIYDITSSIFEPTGAWGLKANTTPNNQYFFDRVEVYEIFDQYYTQVNFINPKFVNIEFQQMDQEISAGNEVIGNMLYEGIVIEKISERITQSIANRFGLPFVQDRGQPSAPFQSGPVSLFNNVIGQINNTLASGDIFGGIQRTIGAITGTNIQPFGGFLGSIASNVLGGQINSAVSGSVSFDPLSQTANLIPSVNSRANSGTVVRDIATGEISRPPSGTSQIKF